MMYVGWGRQECVQNFLEKIYVKRALAREVNRLTDSIRRISGRYAVQKRDG
jgi:hypothetical protein